MEIFSRTLSAIFYGFKRVKLYSFHKFSQVFANLRGIY